MGFTKTSEGRVFFQNADNDDQPKTNGAVATKSATPASANRDALMARDNTQMQILLLLKTLNTKLKSSRTDQEQLKKDLAEYKETIKNLEKKASDQESNYIDLEQKVARKQAEAGKKTQRVEENLQKTLTHLAQAKTLVTQLEKKSSDYEATLKDLKDETSTNKATLGQLKGQINDQKSRDLVIIEKQKSLEKTQKEQGEKMVDSVAAYVALTKRVSEAETKNDTLENKIEDARSDYLKLDRKIDKAIEDRNRILRKVERIEQAVLETRDALNAKAMVLLTDQGAIAGVNMPQITDETLRTDPMVLSRRLQEEALMPWWRRPVRLQGTSLVMMMVIVLLLGWIGSSAFNNPAIEPTPMEEKIPSVKLGNIETSVPLKSAPESNTARLSPEDILGAPPSNNTNAVEDMGRTQEESYEQVVFDDDLSTASEDSTYDYTNGYQSAYRPTIQEKTENYGITVHKGQMDKNKNDTNTSQRVINLDNEKEVVDAFENNEQELASQLNSIEPESFTQPTKTKVAPPPPPPAEEAIAPAPQKKAIPAPDKAAYIASLKNRISPDSNLGEIAKKIETQAFQGIPEAQHDMGAIYVAGHGQIKQDLNRAVFWFTEAAQNGIANAKYNLGVLYHQGLGVPQSVDKAMTLYHEAAEIGHPEAQYNLGIAYIEGIGVEYNPSKAARYFEQAAKQGITEAAYNLGLIYENGLLSEPKPDEALNWYKYAADAGSPEAQSALEQLAASLSIQIEDVNRIVEKLRAQKPTSHHNAANAEGATLLISDIQSELMRRGLYPGPVDGKTGPITENAIKTFQRAANLDVNGNPSQELLGYLRATSQYLR